MKKALIVFLTVVTAAVMCAVTAYAAGSAKPAVSFDAATGTLTLGAGAVKKDDVQAYRKNTGVKHITAESGAELPEDSAGLFKGFKYVTDIDLSKADTSNVTSMRWMFMDCAKLKTVNMSGCSTSKVTNMNAMFIRCYALEKADLTGIDTSSLIDAESMFEDCKKLKTLDLSYFDTSGIEYWSSMFKGCSSLKTIYASDRWTGVGDTYVTTWLLEPLFAGCTSLKGGNGTAYIADAKEDKIYARVDRKGEPGYLTYKAVEADSSTGSVTCEIMSADTVRLKWEAVAGADRYYIGEADTDGKCSVTKNECVVSGLKADTEYCLYISPEAKDGSKQSGDLSVKFGTPAKSAATGSVKAPASASYKLINHDKTNLKWGAVSGADGYKLYRMCGSDSNCSPSFCVFEEVTALAEKTYSLKKLTPYTNYTYAVTAYKKTGDMVTESAMRKVTFTTPEKWYYTKGNEDFVSRDDPAYDYQNVYRYHYDGTGLKKFSFWKYIPEEAKWGEVTEKTYAVDAVQQYGGYVYLYLSNLDNFIDDEGCMTETYRFSSDGTAFETVYFDKPARRLVTDKGTVYIGYDTGITNGMSRNLTNAYVQTGVTDKDGIFKGVTLFREKGSYISDLANDDEYLYFFTTPYRVSDRYIDDRDYVPSKYAKLYRVRLSEPETLTYNDYGYLQEPKWEEMTECLCSFKYPYSTDGISKIDVTGIKDGYLYYTVNKITDPESDDNLVLYRVSVTTEKPKPEMLLKLGKIGTVKDMRINGSYIYIFADRSGYRVKLGGKKYTLTKTFTVSEGYFVSTDYALSENMQLPVVIENGYIYLTSLTSSKYYRVKLNGKNLISSSKPFVWR